MSETSIVGIPNKWLRENKILVSCCSDWDKEFLSSIFDYYREEEYRSPKQRSCFKKIQHKCRLDKIPDELPKEKPKINQNIKISHEKSVKIVKLVVVKLCGKGWDSYTKGEQKFIEDLSVQIQKPGAKLNGEQIQKIREIVYSTKNRNYRYNRFVGRRLREWITREKTGFRDNTIKITAVKRISESGLAILCDLVIIKKGYKEILEDEWVPIRQIF